MSQNKLNILYEKLLEQDIFIFYVLLDIYYYRASSESSIAIDNSSDTAISSVVWKNMGILFKEIRTVVEEYLEDSSYYVLWGLSPTINQQILLKRAFFNNGRVLIFEDAFLRSIHSYSKISARQDYKEGISFTVDQRTAYYDCSKASDLEMMLNSRTFKLSKEQEIRAINCIEAIISNCLSKYNDQPHATEGKIHGGRKKVLVIDQSKGDLSVKMGGCNASTFQKMLDYAIVDNSEADILVKIHPDTVEGARDGYLTNAAVNQNIKILNSSVNPISLIKQCDKVYVCTSQVGFEALMCGKEVHVFGVPFYAGWGLTHDYQKCERRRERRTLAEVFYISYIVYSHYINPYKRTICQIEEAIEILIKQRNDFLIQGV